MCDAFVPPGYQDMNYGPSKHPWDSGAKRRVTVWA